MKICKYKIIINIVFWTILLISSFIILPFSIQQIIQNNSILLLLILVSSIIATIMIFIPISNFIIGNIFKCQIEFGYNEISYK